MHILLLLFFNVIYIYAASDSETSIGEKSADTPRVDGHCISMPCSSLISLASNGASSSSSPLIMRSHPRLLRHASVSSCIELSQSEESPRVQPIAATETLAQDAPSPTAAYITDTLIARLGQKLKKRSDSNAGFISSLSALSVLTTKNPALINRAYHVFIKTTADEPARHERASVYTMCDPTQKSPEAIRLMAWEVYQTTIMNALCNRLKKHVPRIVTKATHELYIAYTDPEPAIFTPKQITILQQHIVAYAYVLGEQEQHDPDLFERIFATQLMNYNTYQASVQQQQLAKPLEQSLLQPHAIRITDMEIASTIRNHTASGSNILTEFLNNITMASLQTPELLHAAHTLFVSIISLRGTAGPRRCALDASRSIGLRSECWQAYHLAIMQQLNDYLKEKIPDVTTDPSKLYIALPGPVTLSPEQAKCLLLYILVYAIMLSEQEKTDPHAFAATFNEQLQYLQPYQPRSSLYDARRKRSGSSVARLSGKFGWTKKGGASSSAGT